MCSTGRSACREQAIRTCVAPESCPLLLQRVYSVSLLLWSIARRSAPSKGFTCSGRWSRSRSTITPGGVNRHEKKCSPNSRSNVTMNRLSRCAKSLISVSSMRRPSTFTEMRWTSCPKASLKNSSVRGEGFSSSSSFKFNFLVISQASAEGHRCAHVSLSQLWVRA